MTVRQMDVVRPRLEMVPRFSPPLDPGFRPLILGLRNYRAAVRVASEKQTLRIALEREDGRVVRWDLEVLPEGGGNNEDTFRVAERTIKFLLWSRGGWKLHLAGPAWLCQKLSDVYRSGGARGFDADLMTRIYQKPFEVVCVAREKLPEALEMSSALGGHLDGCRIGFDLGASDYKLAAVKDGECVFSTEIPWNPRVEADPSYHYRRIHEGFKLAASHLPRVDAIGGSSAGVIVDNQVMVASLFRSVPKDVFDRQVRPLFLNLQKEWGVPLVVVNDGDVSALAGALSLNRKAMLGVAMGSSEATGFLDRRGMILGWLNELAFAPVDLNPSAPSEEWSGDRGVGALYFSQQAVNKLAPAAGLGFPVEMGLPDRLKVVQEKMAKNEEAAARIYESIGVYFGYTVALYADFYDVENMLILGRVTSGAGGDMILEKTREVLRAEFPELAEKIVLHVPDEKSRRVGQAVAAASLPEIGDQ